MTLRDQSLASRLRGRALDDLEQFIAPEDSHREVGKQLGAFSHCAAQGARG
jgi:hypothetical protein